MVPGYRRYDLVYDGTAINANEELASGLHSYLTSPIERWFELGVEGDTVDTKSGRFAQRGSYADDPDALEWLEVVSDLMYCSYAYPPCNVNPTLHEAYLDLGAFGSCIICQEWTYDDGGHLVFKSFPLADCYYLENADGVVDSMFRYYLMTGRQICDEFKMSVDMLKSVAPKIAKQIESRGGMDRTYRMIHHVFTREDRDLAKAPVSFNKKFGSVYVTETTHEVLEEQGYDSFPYHVSRWLKIAGEVYGRGPAMKCLPDIKSLNLMEKIILKAGQKAIDPPLVVPDDGFLLPIKTAPGSLIFKEPGAGDIVPLEFKGNMQFAIEYPNQKRDYIKECFYSEWLKMMKEDKQMTATEVVDRRDEKLRLLAPMLGRQQTELLGPMITRTYFLLKGAQRLPPPPESLAGQRMKIAYVSPAARAQQGVKGQSMSAFIQDLVPLAQINPDVIDCIDMDKMAQKYAIIRGVPRSVLRSPQEIAQIRQQKAQQQQIAQAAQVAEPASKAMLNISKAQNPGT
jgi:hypothetical protein